MSSNNGRLTTLSEISDKIGDGLHGTPIYDDLGNYYFINGNNLDGKIRLDASTKRVPYSEYQKYKKELNDRTILLSINGTLGKLAYYNNEPVILGKSACYINIKEGIDKNYVYFKLQSPQFLSYLESHSSGTTIKNLGLKEIRSFAFKLPKFEVQKATAEILTSINDKIEINNKINSNLEELAQTLYKRWFVDFEFPNEEGKPYKSSGGEMVESELGLIPKAWSIKKIEEVCETILGGTPSRKVSDYWGGEINWVNSGKVNDIRIIEPSEMITSLGMEKSSTKLLPKKTTVIAITGATLGAVSLLEIDSCANQSVIGFLENSIVKHTFLFPTIQSHITQLIGRQTGGAQQHINKNDVNNYTIVMPNEETLSIFHEKTLSIYDQIALNLFENQKLIELRDLLLPKLMSGEIEV